MPQTTPSKLKPYSTPSLKDFQYHDMREDAIAIQLNAERHLNKKHGQIVKMLEEGATFKNPSKSKYFFLFLIAGIVDLVDVADITGIGILVSKIVSIAGTGIIYFTFWLTDGKTKRAEVYSDNALASLTELQQTVSQYSRLAMQTANTLRKVPGLKGVARSIPRAMVKVRRIAKKNPITRILIGGAINLIPWLAMVNLMIFWVYLSYRDEKRTFKEAHHISQQVAEEIELPQIA